MEWMMFLALTTRFLTEKRRAWNLFIWMKNSSVIISEYSYGLR